MTTLQTASYADDMLALREFSTKYNEFTTISVNLSFYGLSPDSHSPDKTPIGRPDCELPHTFIKDYSECLGTTDRLEAQGLVRKIRRVEFGPFDAAAWEVEVLIADGWNFETREAC